MGKRHFTWRLKQRFEFSGPYSRVLRTYELRVIICVVYRHRLNSKISNSSIIFLLYILPSRVTVCSAKADIGILIDGSSSVTQDKFAKLLDFTKSLVKSFSVSLDRTHIAVATASRGPHMSFDFRGFNDVPSINTAISRISYLGGPFLLGNYL